MCGRFLLMTPSAEIAQLFGVTRPLLAEFSPRYNIAPQQDVAVIRQVGTDRELVPMRWGFVPPWADDPAIGNRMINARSETAHEKPAFRDAFRSARCLIPADGFYEWKALDSKTKQPMCVRRTDGRPYVMAGLWSTWTGQEGPLETCTVLTREAVGELADVHERMPVMLETGDRWLDGDDGVLREPPTMELRLYPVSTKVNAPRNDDPSLLDEIDPRARPDGQFGLFG